MKGDPPEGADLEAAPVALLLGAVVVAGLALRLFRLLDLPAGPWVDEAYALRAAREATAHGWLAVPASVPLEPAGSPFVNFWVTGPYLVFTSLVDRAAGGGMTSFRLLSTLPGVALLFSGLFLAWEALRPSRRAFLMAAFLLSSSSWLLSTSRWGWAAVFSSALITTSAGLAFRALRAKRGAALALASASGVVLGLAQYGYLSAWLLAPVPFAALVLAAIDARSRPPEGGSGRLRLEIAASVAVGFLVAAGPLAAHFAAHPERASARPQELSPAGGGAASAVRLVAGGVPGYLGLFLTGGDPNERHGSPGRPVLPVAVSGLALVGLAVTVRRPGRRLLPAVALLLLSGGLLAAGSGPNAFRISAAAPFLIVLAAVGGVAIEERIPDRNRGGLLLAGIVVVSGTLDAAGFLSWLSSPRLSGAFGGPERELADAIGSELGRGGTANVALDPRAARNPWVVDVLLAPPAAGGRRVLAWVRDPARVLAAAGGSSRDLLLAVPPERETLELARRLGGRPVAGSTPLDGFDGWVLFRVPRVKRPGSSEGPPPIGPPPAHPGTPPGLPAGRRARLP